METLAIGAGRRTAASQNRPRHYDIVVFSHLRWEFVYQRPQHIISRLSRHMKILFIEEPVGESDGQTGNLKIINDRLHVLQPMVAGIAEIKSILGDFLAGSTVPLGWFYSPSFVPLLDQIKFEHIVYDCMDELSLFKGAPQTLVDQEKHLMRSADLVFTGGKSLYEAKWKMHSNVYCFPSSVDTKHFATANLPMPADMATIEGPIVGYYGVIDERIDLTMLAEAAALLPHVNLVLVGPLAKITDADLPRRENIHYLGMKSYEELPAYLCRFDIAMMPFALNDATKYISPTKTLEYMAANKPIISTRITDVVRDYSHCVTFADDAEEFCDAVNEILDQKPNNAGHYQPILKRTSWDATVYEMKKYIKELAQ